MFDEVKPAKEKYEYHTISHIKRQAVSEYNSQQYSLEVRTYGSRGISSGVESKGRNGTPSMASQSSSPSCSPVSLSLTVQKVQMNEKGRGRVPFQW